MKYIYFFILLTFGLSSCVKNNALPIWLEINTWDLNPSLNPLNPQGELTHNITDVSVYVDNKIIGVFEVPCKIPVLLSGSCKVVLLPTIRNNGISSTKKVYPFLTQFETTLDLVPGQTYTINPTTEYYSSTVFWIEDFENSTIKIIDDLTVSNATMNKESNSSIGHWGNYGHIALNTTDSLWMGVTSDSLYLPKSGAEVYLEIDYMNTNSVLTGVFSYPYGALQNNPNISMNRQNSDLKWKKIYIDLKDIVSNSGNSIYFRQYIRTLLDPDLSQSDIYIDNIKVVHAL
ncbi:hypothetical protein [Fluviicola taffensis]|uniref:Lipoprotein n=1 Tax=Fluviicola taffensis (strain DSM 16823 / NCIMB 13979 / RW262) TaxID=755732 RepID=F2ICP0_FLUTR|nr:hypothetical protein [Fluviicola taffensis]AEA42267.1 hypothetical protein Fluta_0258 [Fluviicola taffensis DSM 16823]